jgi:hypothetical protein
MRRADPVFEAFVVLTLITALCVLMWAVLVVPDQCGTAPADSISPYDWPQDAPRGCVDNFPPYPPKPV